MPNLYAKKRLLNRHLSFRNVLITANIKNKQDMKKILMMAVAGFFCLSASAQYPQLTDEAKQLIEQQKKQWKAHSDSAWAVAFPIVIEEAKAGRPYVPWAARPYDCVRLRFLHSLELMVVVCTPLADVVARCSPLPT